MHEPSRLVAAGYDAMAEEYAAWAGRRDRRAEVLREVTALLPAGGTVLDLGCGTGERATRLLVDRFRVVGVDISARSVALARERVPGASFVRADMASLGLRPGSFDAVVAFFSLIHVPREHHAGVLADIATWLRPGGLFVASLGANEWTGTGDFFGAPMYWSHWDAATNLRLVQDAGMVVQRAEEITEAEDGVPVTFLWVVAQVLRGTNR